jgi:uncharacterized membrane protein
VENKISKKTLTKVFALAAVMAALVAVATFIIQIPIPATGGYLNFGDIMIFISALTFGPTVGGFAGGIGSFISDVAGGYAAFAPFTLIIKGIEGIIAGSISNRKNAWRDVIAVIFAGIEMVIGYFLAEFFALSEGWGALGEVPGNIIQIVAGAAIGVPIAILLRKRIPETWKM